MISSADEASLRQLVGPRTFARAVDYARAGAVRWCEWVDEGTRVVGRIQGGASEPYSASATLTRSSSERLSAFRGVCSCPVAINCKHVVALLLAPEIPSPPLAPEIPSPPSVRQRPFTLVTNPTTPARSNPGPAGRSGRDSASWERPLRAVLAGDPQAFGDIDSPEIGLQFEVVPFRPQPGRGLGAAAPGIRLRPVIPGRTGNWVRTGISWTNLDYFGYGRARSRETVAQLGLLKELLALSRLASSRGYGYPEVDVWLESINSRRLWDVLREARDLQLPLVTAARRAQHAILHPSPAVVTLDVRRVGAGLRLEPFVVVGDVDVTLGSSVLLGEPGHGLAWWEEVAGSPGEPGRLHLASFDQPVDDTLRSFLAGRSVGVPQRDEERFLQEFYPALHRRVAVRSGDESVEFPETTPPMLVLSVGPGQGHRLSLLWARSAVGALWREGLWEGPRRAHRDTDEAILQAAGDILASIPELFEATPVGERLAQVAHLGGMVAVRFVSELLPLLQAIDGLEIELTGTLPDYRESDAVPVVSLNGSQTQDGDWFDLSVEVTVGGEEVPFQDLFVALAEQQSHLILPSGTYFSLDRPELRQLADLIAEARALDDTSGDGIRLSRFQASLWDELQRLGVVTAQASAWEASVRALSEAKERTEHPTPASLHATLRPYQLVGFNWLAFLYEHRLGGVLADDMGLGKTLEALALMCHVRDQGPLMAPFLVIAPTSVVENWASECRRFAPGLRAVALGETDRRRKLSLAEVAAGADVVITSYALFRLDYDAYEAIDFSGLFLDEAQFAKNRTSQNYQRAKMLPVAFKVAMSGTPIENNLMELWSLLSIAAPGLFAKAELFEKNYRLPIEKHANVDLLAQLRRRIRPLMLRRTKEQVAADLPEKQEQVLELELNPRHKKLYQMYLARERQKVLGLLDDMSKNRFEILRSLTLLRQASLDVSLVDPKHAKVPSTKLDALMEMLDDIVADGHRVLVFSQFTRFLGEARARIQAAGIEHSYLDGRTRNRAAAIAAFRAGDAPVFLISLKAGGFGLNLTEADYCILLDPWWNPATEAQAVDRIHRIGQTRKTMVYRLVAKNTIEEKVMALKAKKAALFANVMDAGGFEAGALTAADIRSLLS